MKIGFIGAGNMAEAILRGLLSGTHQLYAYDISSERVDVMKEMGVSYLEKDHLLDEVEVVVLAIKPYHYQDFIVENKDALNGKLVVCIAAGITDLFLSTLLGHKRYCRVMPNTPALIGMGVTGICENEALQGSDLDIVKSIFESVGSVVMLAQSSFDTIIPLTGSSPAYTFMYIDELIKVGLENNIAYEDAKELACKAVIGAANLFLTKDEKAPELVDKVCSKGGTTIEGVKSLKEDDFSGIVNKALNKCLDRAKEMNEENDNSL